MTRQALAYLGLPTDFVYDASMLAVAKVVGRRGDGKANMALWRLLLPDFHANGHVNAPDEIKKLLLTYNPLQVKYAIECLRRICIAEGSMGERMAIDVTWNDSINTKGASLDSSNLLQGRFSTEE